MYTHDVDRSRYEVREVWLQENRYRIRVCPERRVETITAGLPDRFDIGVRRSYRYHPYAFRKVLEHERDGRVLRYQVHREVAEHRFHET